MSQMSQLQIEEFVATPDELDAIGADVADADEPNVRSQRSALYKGLRQRDAWLRKAWGRTRPVELQ